MASPIRERLLDGIAVVSGLCAISVTVWFASTEMRGPSAAGNRGSVGTEIVQDWETYRDGGHLLGSATATVVVVEFGDYQCSACRFFHRSLATARRVLGDSLAIVYRHLPLDQIHPMAETAARAAECAAEQGRFEPYHDLLYESSGWLALGARAFEDYARLSEVPDSARFSDCLFSSQPVAAIARDRAAAAALRIDQTPSLLINQHLFRGASDSTKLIEAIRSVATRR